MDTRTPNAMTGVAMLVTLREKRGHITYLISVKG